MSILSANTATCSPVVKRTRLFKLIESQLAGQLTWISAAAGYGKSTLVSSFLQHRSDIYFWVDVDEDDDPNRIFQRIAKLAFLNGIDSASLPLYCGESCKDLSMFSKAFFQCIFSLVPSFFLWIWDDMHRAKNNRNFYIIFSQFLEVLPWNAHCLVMGRELPPIEFANHMAKAGSFYITFGDLKFDVSELRDFIRVNCIELSELNLLRLMESTGGWVGGIKLLLTDYKHASDYDFYRSAENSDRLFSYFSNTIFGDLSCAEKRDLARISLCSCFNKDIVRLLCESENMLNYIDCISKNSCFICFDSQRYLSYEFHDLFRSFLRIELSKIEAPGRISLLNLNLAKYFNKISRHDLSVSLLLRERDNSTARDIVEVDGFNMLEWGKIATLKELFSLIDKNSIDHSPRLRMLSAVLDALDNPKNSIECLRSLLSFLLKQDDDVLLSWCWCFYANLAAFLWEELHEVQCIFPEVESRLHKYIFTDDSRSDHVIVPKYMEGALALAAHLPDINPALEELVYKSGEYALHKCNPNDFPLLYRNLFIINYFGEGHYGIQDKLIQYLDEKSKELDFSPFLSYVKKVNDCEYSLLNYKLIQARNILADITKIRSKNDVALLRPACDSLGVHIAVLSNMSSDASKELREYFSQSHCRNSASLSHYYRLFAWQALNQNDLYGALESSKKSLEYFGGGRVPIGLITSIWLCGVSCVFSRRFAEAEEFVSKCETLLRKENNLHYYDLLLLKCFYFLRRNNLIEAKTYLEKAISKSIELRCVVSFYPVYNMLAELYSFGLENNIYSDYINRQVGLLPLENKNKADEYWPRRLRFYSLNGLGIYLNSKRVSFGKKTPKKVVELLKAIFFLGGEGVAISKLCSYLWPDADKDSARKSFDTTMHRLRKIIGKSTVQVGSGYVSLEEGSCWMDIWSLQEAVTILKRLVTADDLCDRNLIGVEKQLSRIERFFRGFEVSVEKEVDWLCATSIDQKSKILFCLKQVAEAASTRGYKFIENRVKQLCFDIELSDIHIPGGVVI